MATRATYEVINARTGAVLADRALLADGPVTRAKGLLGKKGLERGEALIIRPCWSIHTWFMRFPIDVLFLGKQSEVKKVRPRIPAWRFAASRGAQTTIEFGPGALEGQDIQPGDPVTIRPVAMDS
jgi:uncharacterized membrane protein (UPF0127 family)